MSFVVQKREFHDAVHANIAPQPNVEVARERDHEELWLLQGMQSVDRATIESWMRMDAMDDKLLLELGGMYGVPVKISQYQRTIHKSVLRLFGAKKNETKKYQSLYRDFHGNREWQEFEKIPGDTKNGLLVFPQRTANTGNLSDFAPYTSITRVGIAHVLELPAKKVVYQEITRIEDGHTPETNVIDRRQEGQIQGTELLTPELREYLSAMGKIVYESDPKDTDRLLVCFKHVHGISGIRQTTAILEGNESTDLLEHQHHISEAQLHLLKTFGPEKTRIFAESFPLTQEGISEELNRLYKARVLLNDMLSGAVPVPEDFPLPIEDLKEVSMVDTTGNAIKYCLEKDAMHIINGDGRYEAYEIHEENEQMRERQLEMSLTFFGQSGAAAGITDVSKKENAELFEEPQANVLMRMAKTMQPGTVGSLVYGGAHFQSGTTTPEMLEPRLFEDYLQFLPRTHIVVVEEFGFPTYMKNMKRRKHVRESLLPPKILSAFVQGADIVHKFAKSMEFAAQKWLAAETEEDREKYAEHMRDYHEHVNRFLEYLRIFMRMAKNGGKTMSEDIAYLDELLTKKPEIAPHLAPRKSAIPENTVTSFAFDEAESTEDFHVENIGTEQTKSVENAEDLLFGSEESFWEE